jgi:hypothetical protein
MTMHKYHDTHDEVVKTYGRAHDTSEQTHVVVLSCGEDHYAAVAYDVDPGDFEPVAAECIAYDPTLEGACQRAERWMETNSKGVLGGQPQGSEGGKQGSKVVDILKRIVRGINDYGNQQVDDIQQQGGGKQ